MKIELRQLREVRNVQSRAERHSRRILQRLEIIPSVQLAVENQIVPAMGNVKRPVHAGTAATGNRMVDRGYSEQAVNEISRSERSGVGALSSNDGRARKPEFEIRNRLEVHLLTVDKRLMNDVVTAQAPEKFVRSCRSQELKNPGQLEWLRVRQSNH